MSPALGRKWIIALDGPAAAGKGTLARKLAAHFNLATLDTGAIYRAVARKVIELGADPGDPRAAMGAAASLRAEDLQAPGLREEAVSRGSSVVAAIPAVRRQLIEFQRRFAKNPPGNVHGALLDGRDIGTVICPEADVKIFLTASLEARAERRFQELRRAGQDPIKARVLEDMRARDGRDASRATAPLKAAPGAFELDTTGLDEDQVFARVLDHIGQKLR